MYLTAAEVKVLAELEDGRWRVPSEIAEEADVHTQLVRDSLKQLNSRRLVERGGWGDSTRWGEWRISDTGQEELVRRRQLELPV